MDLAAESSAIAPTTALKVQHSGLADELVLDWGMGAISAHSVYRYAHHSFRDHQGPYVNMELKELSQIGASGIGHCAAKLKAMYTLDDSKMPEPFGLLLPLWDARIKEVVYITVPMVLPSELLHCFFMHYREEFDKRILGGSPSKITEFWDGAHPDDPRLIDHPLRKRSDFTSKCIPFGMHGDGVPWKKSGVGQSMAVFLFSSLLGYGPSTWDVRWIFFRATPIGEARLRVFLNLWA